MRDWMDEPEDPRPVIATCEFCGADIHGETKGCYCDPHYDFTAAGLGCVCEDCLQQWADRFYKKW